MRVEWARHERAAPSCEPKGAVTSERGKRARRGASFDARDRTFAQDATGLRSFRSRVEWRKRLGVEPSPPAQRGKQPILKTGRATGPRSLPEARRAYAVIIIRMRDGTRRRRFLACGKNWREKNPGGLEDAPGMRQMGNLSAFDQTDFASARTLARLFRRELDTLTFAQQLEHGAPDRAAVEEVLDSAFVADEAEALVDQKPSDRPGWHTRVLR
jgi:hypothetical protein